MELNAHASRALEERLATAGAVLRSAIRIDFREFMIAAAEARLRADAALLERLAPAGLAALNGRIEAEFPSSFGGVRPRAASGRSRRTSSFSSRWTKRSPCGARSRASSSARSARACNPFQYGGATAISSKRAPRAAGLRIASKASFL